MKREKRLPGFEEWPEEFRGFLDSEGLQGLTEQEDFQDIEDTLHGNLETRLRVLKQALQEIDTEIGFRAKVSDAFQLSLKESRREVSRLLMEIEHLAPGYKPSVDSRRTALERELLSLYREARAEKRQAFSDLMGLRREKRKLEMEYKSLKATAETLKKERLGSRRRNQVLRESEGSF